MARYKGRLTASATVVDRQAEFAFGRMAQQMEAVVALATIQATELLHKTAVRRINKRTGRTSRTIYKLVRRTPLGVVGRVGSDDAIATGLEFGTKAHVIRPTERHRAAARAEHLAGRRRTDQAYLRFRMGGRIVYATEVHHPGTKAYRWLKRAQEETEPRIVAIYDRTVRKTLEGG